MRTVIVDHELLPKGLNLEGLSVEAGIKNGGDKPTQAQSAMRRNAVSA